MENSSQRHGKSISRAEQDWLLRHLHDRRQCGSWFVMLILIVIAGLLPAAAHAHEMEARKPERAKSAVSAGPRVKSHFTSITDFSEWQSESSETMGESLVSPVMKAPFAFDELIPSWIVRVPVRSPLKFEVCGVYPDRRTKYFVLGEWTTENGDDLRKSIPGQKDDDGDVLTDMLVLSKPCARYQVRISFCQKPSAGERDAELPPIHLLGICLLDSKANLKERTAKPVAWGREIDVPRRSQRSHTSLGGNVWCSPTSVSMVLAYWSKDLGRPELDVDVPTVAKAVHDPKWPGTGNWPFNTAYAGTFEGIHAHVDRLDDLKSLEDWIARDVPVICSVVLPLLDGKASKGGGHLVVCVGFTEAGEVIINDPWADPNDLDQVRRVISRENFSRAWKRSKHAAYLIYPEKLDSETQFVRIQRDDDGRPTTMQTSVTSYVPKGDANPKLKVDLIAAVHIGDKSYYDQLNALFESYDAVLFELVAPKGTRLEPGHHAGSSHPISILQRTMRDVLNLEFQLECIDYSKENMVHADMTPSQFQQSMKDRGESFFQMFWRMMRHAMESDSAASKSNVSDLDLILALLRSDRSLQLKRLLADQFEDLEQQMAGLQGADGSTIITERNKLALNVLREEIGKGKLRVGIFYGAGHLADMETRLHDDFGLRLDRQRWLIAWSMDDESKDSGAKKQSTDADGK